MEVPVKDTFRLYASAGWQIKLKIIVAKQNENSVTPCWKVDDY